MPRLEREEKKSDMKICVRIEGENGNVIDVGFDTEEQANSFIFDIKNDRTVKTAYIFWQKCEDQHSES